MNIFGVRFNSFVQQRQGEALAKLLSLPQNQSIPNGLSQEAINAISQSVKQQQFRSLLVRYLTFLGAQEGEDSIMDNLMGLVSVFATQVYTSDWLNPVLRLLCRFGAMTAVELDNRRKLRGAKPIHGVALQTHLSRLIAVIMSDRPISQEIKSGLLIVVNAIFHIYFSLNEMHLCSKVMGQLERSVEFSVFSKSDQVVFYFYAGRLKLYFHEFESAEAFLNLAFTHCLSSEYRIKKNILSYLVPARIVRGWIPQSRLLQKYHLDGIFTELVDAFQAGDYETYHNIVDANRKWFMKRNLYLIMKQRPQLLMLRNVFLKSFKVYQSINPSRFNIPLSVLLSGTELMKFPDMDLDEVECIVASLIEQGLMRGYLQHESCMVVLAKANSFPTPAAVLD